MSGTQRRGGIIEFKVDGEVYQAKGNFTYNLGGAKREGIPGADEVHGYKETIQIPFIEGEITDSPDLSLTDFLAITDATVTLTLANGKMIALYNAWNASEGTGNTDEGNIAVRFEGRRAAEVK